MRHWPWMPGNTRRAVGVCFEGDQVHWAEIVWVRRQPPRLLHWGCASRQALVGLRQWRAHWRQVGMQARHAGLVLHETSLVRLRLTVPAGLSAAERWLHLEEALQDQLPWPLSDTAWDCQWLAPVQAQTKPHEVEVVAAAKGQVREQRQWCRQAGLRLMRLEPEAQAQSRAERWASLWPEPPLAHPAAAHLALGLALGAVTP